VTPDIGAEGMVNADTERLRAHTRRCIDAALAAVDPGMLVRTALDGQRRFTTTRPNGLAVLAVGKAADAMMAATLVRLRAATAFALVVAPQGTGTPVSPAADDIRQHGGVPVRRVTAPHPIPGPAGANAARMVIAWLDALPPGAKLLVLLSGGASSLLALPAPGLTMVELAETTRLLLNGGLSIDRVNAVRKHLEVTKGGQLAERVTGRDVLVLAISDVVGDRLDVIASGPFHPDPSTFADALDALDSANLREQLPAAVLRVLEEGRAGSRRETPKPGNACFTRITHCIIGSGRTARDAAGEAAAELGYAVTAHAAPVTGEAREAGARVVAAARRLEDSSERGTAFVAFGETTVTVRGDGRGGRNQELALGAALAIEGDDRIVAASIGTDGIDGPTDAAGAIVDGFTAERMRRAGIEPAAVFERNDSFAALDAAGDLLRTGATGTNVGDVQIVLRSASDVVR
jgi:glycerate 2-kinase